MLPYIVHLGNNQLRTTILLNTSCRASNSIFALCFCFSFCLLPLCLFLSEFLKTGSVSKPRQLLFLVICVLSLPVNLHMPHLFPRLKIFRICLKYWFLCWCLHRRFKRLSKLTFMVGSREHLFEGTCVKLNVDKRGHRLIFLWYDGEQTVYNLII